MLFSSPDRSEIFVCRGSAYKIVMKSGTNAH